MFDGFPWYFVARAWSRGVVYHDPPGCPRPCWLAFDPLSSERVAQCGAPTRMKTRMIRMRTSENLRKPKENTGGALLFFLGFLTFSSVFVLIILVFILVGATHWVAGVEFVRECFRKCPGQFVETSRYFPEMSGKNTRTAPETFPKTCRQLPENLSKKSRKRPRNF